ncbi:MAG: nucleoside triphosphate pyrophosphohydrolase [Candidatus Glassbacteria bacterium GWA2_58_10]|uniref:Nucleoside triphosphate pyrophosphohydrolase n=1 Tax=Candidatus Glassbacteria bacterium GWA2_58_10 TaxID=1817865 RepID=A0A1F5YHJ3_9BACT|nr:MAG: nucleoside triphosphate pyrophosphohydrolase [Candidatus Glassbacteria bacterium GWA2_58_10]
MTHDKEKAFSAIDTVEQLTRLVDFLRSGEGCPWDREQSSRSLKPYFQEEFHELLEAIDSGRSAELREELGDVLLHLCFQVSLAREAGQFTLADVVAGVRDKMIRRHPHVFGGVEFASRQDQLFAWEQIKRDEKADNHGSEAADPQASILDGLPESLPPLLKSYRIQGRVSKYHFDWEKPDELFAKIEEELTELRSAMDSGRGEAVEEEIGDLLFTVVNLARLLKVHPQPALEGTNRKFSLRFRKLEQRLRQRGLKLGKLSLEELDQVWAEVKAEEAGKSGPSAPNQPPGS